MLSVNEQSRRLYQEASRAYASGDYYAAESMFSKLLKQAPNNAETMFSLAATKVKLSDFSGARRHLRRAMEIKRRPPPDWFYVLSHTYRGEGKFDEAHEALDRGLAAHPDSESLVSERASLHAFTGDHEKAYEIAQGLIDGGSREAGAVITFATACRRLKRQDEAVPFVRELVADGSLPRDARQRAWFALAALLDSTKDYDGAFDAYRQGNELEHSRFDPDAFSAEIDRMIDAFSPEAFERLPVARAGKSGKIIFVLGMRRSGTSLVEQILSSHPSVYGAGELDDLRQRAVELQGDPPNAFSVFHRLDRLTSGRADQTARKYVNSVLKASPSSDRVVDKAPSNWKFIGLIARCLPDAKIIHCVRDPMDTCVSNYFQLFKDNSYACRLDWLGRYFRDYARAVSHFRDALGVPMLDVRYEEVVADQEGQTRRMLDFMGLDWDDACLSYYESDRVTRTASNDQVTRPIYTSSVARHERYGASLDPLRDALGDAHGAQG